MGWDFVMIFCFGAVSQSSTSCSSLLYNIGKNFCIINDTCVMLMMNGSEGQVSCVVSASQLSLIGSLFAALLVTTYLLEIIIFRSFFSRGSWPI